MVGVDGEGQDVPCGGCPACVEGRPKDCSSPNHIYTYLAIVDERGSVIADAYSEAGLSHEDCVAALLKIPKDCLPFAFMFQYDVTMILRDLSLADIYYLMRPQLRDETVCKECRKTEDRCSCEQPTERISRTRPVRIRGRRYDFFNGSLTIRDHGRSVKIWDCFRFFGCAFVSAIESWKIGTREQLERIAAMKAKRGSFADESPEDVRRYCREECLLLAQMMRLLIEAHEQAEIDLRRFDGAGSTASALLRANDVASFRGPKISDLDPGLAYAIAMAFSGGRFEDSVVGVVEEPVYGFDISSAYPYAQTFLPCLACGRWRREPHATPAMLSRASMAVAAFRVHPVSARERSKIAWCPLPFRDENGSICYGANFYGWAWAPELLAALEGWPDLVELTGEAWIYETDCSHRPFGYVPNAYRRRCEWGKEGKGIVVKLGINAGYGKTAQAIGEDPPFQCWPFAGVTTATTRGQLLSAISSASDPWNVLAVATDGIVATEDLPIAVFDGSRWRPAPGMKDTGTGDLAKPLGGWERKPFDEKNPCTRPSYPEGMMIVKPGLYWRLGVEGTKELRARGIGRKEAFEARGRIRQGFLDWSRDKICTCLACRSKGPKERKEHHVRIVSRRFYGAKHSILARSRCATCGASWPGVPEKGCTNELCPNRGEVGCDFQTTLQKDANGVAAYGRWAPRDVLISFDPWPKREREGLSKDGTYARLRIRDLGGRTSAAYDVGTRTTTPEGEAQRAAREFMMEQPDYEEGI